MATKRRRKDAPSGATRAEISDTFGQDEGNPFAIADIVGTILVLIGLLVLPFETSMLGRISAGIVVILATGLSMLTIHTPRAWSNLTEVLIKISAAGGIGVAIPSLWPPVLVAMTALLFSSIPLMHRFQSVIAGAVTIVFVAIADAGGTSWVLSATTLAIMLFATESWYRGWRMNQARTDEMYEELVDQTRSFFFELDPNNRLIAVSGNTIDVLGRTNADLKGAAWTAVFVDRLDAEPRSEQVLPTDLVGATATMRARNAHGQDVALRVSVRQTQHADHLLCSAVDVTELEDANARLRQRAETDALTGLANRYVFRTRLTAVLNQRVEPQQVGVLIADLDRFKEVNDTLGHSVGDDLLKVLAVRFTENFGDRVDLIARMGGDEFAFVVTGAESADAVVELAREIHDCTAGAIEMDGLHLSTGSSIGVALAPTHGTSVEQLLRRADIAMYAAKLQRAGVTLFSSAPEKLTVERLTLSSQVQRALDNEEFELWLQPKLDLSTLRITGAEGLARWRHPNRGVLAPSRFLNLLELAGDYQRFTHLMLEQAVGAATTCTDHLESFDIAVNLGPMSFLDRDLSTFISQLLSDAQFRPSQLTLEVTEEALLGDEDALAEVFDRLSNLGVRLSIDDFGTGYSSLTRLRAVPVNEVKIDRAFVSGLGLHPEDSVIVRTVIELAKLLGLHVVAEGIDSAHQLRELVGLGCDSAQGFLFAPPMPAKTFITRFTSGELESSWLEHLNAYAVPSQDV